MIDTKKTLMQVSTCKFDSDAEGRPLLTVELDGSVTYHEPMTQAEIKAMFAYMIDHKMYDPITGQLVSSVLFASELARLTRENRALKQKLEEK